MEKNCPCLKNLPALLSLSNIKNLIPLVLEFKSDRYDCWSTLFRVTARAYNVLHHIDATIPTPVESDPLLWVQLDAIVLSWIYATVSKDLLVSILDETSTAMHTWTRLQNLFQHNNQSLFPVQKKRKLNINLNEVADNEIEKEGESLIVDSISCLPDDVLVYLISFVPIKAAGRTSLLSKRWRHVWTHIMDLDFDDHETTTIAKTLKTLFTNYPIPELDNYVKWVNQVISANRAPYLNSFRIHFPLTRFYAADIENWVKSAFSKNVRNLELDFWSNFPTIQFCNICPDNSALPVNMTLESLRLRTVCIDGPLLQWVFSNCPNLQHLSIKFCKSSSNVSSQHWNQKLVISSLKLKHLEFIHSLKCLKFEALQISAPNLISFVFDEPAIDVKYLNVPSFVDASFGFLYARHIFCNLDILSGFSSQLKKLSLKYSEVLSFNGFLSFGSVKQLEIVSGPSTYLLSLISLIDACPLLHSFKLKVRTLYKGMWAGMGASAAQVNSIRSHQHLEVVEYVGYAGCESSVNLALCLTEHAPMLKKFIFDPRPYQALEYRYDVYSSEYKENIAIARRHAQRLAKVIQGVDVVIL